MSSKKKPAVETAAPETGPQPIPEPAKRTRGPNKPRAPKQPSFFRVEFDNGSYRMIEDDNEAAVMARISPKVTITSATWQQVHQAGIDGVKLEHKPLPTPPEVNDYTGTPE